MKTHKRSTGIVVLSLNSALAGGGWLTPRSGRFAPGKYSRYPLYRSLGGPQDLSGTGAESHTPPGLDPRTVHPSELSRPTKYQYYSRIIGPHIKCTRAEGKRRLVLETPASKYFNFLQQKIKTRWTIISVTLKLGLTLRKRNCKR
jgi:hypothetical protein